MSYIRESERHEMRCTDLEQHRVPYGPRLAFFEILLPSGVKHFFSIIPAGERTVGFTP